MIREVIMFRKLVLISCVLYVIYLNECVCQRVQNSNRINRMRGSIITNLTRTHSYDDDIVTSHLDASTRIRKIYRMIRDVYNKYGVIWQEILHLWNFEAIQLDEKLDENLICDLILCVRNSLLGGTGQRQTGNFLQKRLPNSTPFPCKTRGYRSRVVPDSVHQLRPGLVDSMALKICE